MCNQCQQESPHAVADAAAPQKRIAPVAAALLSLFAETGVVSAAEHGKSATAMSPAATASMVVTRAGTRPSIKGPAETFTGPVRIDPVLPQVQAPSRLTSAYVSFEPGSRSAWHSHPLGQLLVVTAGAGWVQQDGGERLDIKPGDVIWTPPGVKHWHGATATTALTHLAIQESLDGKNVDWMQKVSDAQYGKQ